MRPLPPPGQPFRPPWWGRGAHVQTVLGGLLPSRAAPLPWEYVQISLPDGDALCLRLLPGTSGVMVHLFHGLGGSADAGYLRRLSGILRHRGHGVALLNHRGAGEGRGLAARPYHSGAMADLSAAMALGRRRFPDHAQVAVGFSLSGNILLLLLGTADPGLCRPDAAIAVNPPADLEACSRRLLRGVNRFYDRHFVGALVSDVRARCAAGLIPPVAFPPRMTLRDFDALYTAAQAGFSSRDEYYRRCACGPHLQSITVPTVILSAADDPFAPAEDLLARPRSPQVHLHVEPRGGHMGYLAARPTPLGTRRWLDYALDHYLARLLDNLREPEDPRTD